VRKLSVIGAAVLFALALSSCASGPKPPPPPPGSLEIVLRSDAALFETGCHWLGMKGNVRDYAQARQAFTTLVERYPQSKWRPFAEAFVRLIDEVERSRRQAADLEAALGAAREAAAEARKEAGILRGRLAEEERKRNNAAELERLRVENEELRRNIEQLKRLEIELQRRERLLR